MTSRIVELHIFVKTDTKGYGKEIALKNLQKNCQFSLAHRSETLIKRIQKKADGDKSDNQLIRVA